jgi:hypothetical protein
MWKGRFPPENKLDRINNPRFYQVANIRARGAQIGTAMVRPHRCGASDAAGMHRQGAKTSFSQPCRPLA